MWTLTLCIGLFMGGCVQSRELDFHDRESCERERAYQIQRMSAGWATCSPAKVRAPK